MDKKTIQAKAGSFWESCKTCSKNCLCFCGLKDPKKVAIVSVAIIGLGIVIYRGWHKEIPRLAKNIVSAPVRAIERQPQRTSYPPYS